LEAPLKEGYLYIIIEIKQYITKKGCEHMKKIFKKGIFIIILMGLNSCTTNIYATTPTETLDHLSLMIPIYRQASMQTIGEAYQNGKWLMTVKVHQQVNFQSTQGDVAYLNKQSLKNLNMMLSETTSCSSYNNKIIPLWFSGSQDVRIFRGVYYSKDNSSHQPSNQQPWSFEDYPESQMPSIFTMMGQYPIYNDVSVSNKSNKLIYKGSTNLESLSLIFGDITAFFLTPTNTVSVSGKLLQPDIVQAVVTVTKNSSGELRIENAVYKVDFDIPISDQPPVFKNNGGKIQIKITEQENFTYRQIVMPTSSPLLNW
jgi:hypothetical protein